MDPLGLTALGLLSATLAVGALLWTNTKLKAELNRRNADLALGDRSLRLILDGLQEAVFLYDLDGRIVEVNRKMLELYGIEERALALGTSPLDYEAPGARPPTALAPDAHPDLGKTLTFEWECLSRSGRTFPAEVELTRIDYRGQPHLMAVVRDIGVRKAAVQQAGERASELIRVTQRLQIATRAAQMGIWDWDLATNALVWDDTMVELFGVDPSALTGTYRDWSDRLHPEDRERAVQALEAARTGNHDFDTEFRIVRPDDEERLVRAFGRVIRDTSGSPLRMVGINYDITDRWRARQQLDLYSSHLEDLVTTRTQEAEQARDAANSANAAKSLFLANMSHEIRTPLNAVLGFAQLLNHETGLSTEGRHKVATIIRSGEHLLAIINDILEISRIEAGHVDLRPEPFDWRELLGDVTQQFAARIAEKRLTIRSEAAADLPRYVCADSMRVRQVVSNLLGNAVKFTHRGTIRIDVDRAEPDRLAITVSDSGVGIPASERGSLFQPFERALSGQSVAGGTGLGLAISRRYARLMGGDLILVDGPGPGAVLRFEFDAPAASFADERAPEASLPVLEKAHRGTLVLVVDDLRANRELLKGMLQPQGFEVIEAPDGAEAVRLTAVYAPRVVLMDLLMPGIDGYEATRRIRQSPSPGPLTIIGITASAFSDERERFESSGLDGYLAKPFALRDLHEMMTRLTGITFDGGPPPTPLPVDWTQSLSEALSEGNVTRIRQLGQSAREFDSELATWVSERAARYELDDLRRFLSHRGGR